MSQPVSRFYEFGPFRIDAEKRALLRDGEAVPLAPKVFDTLLLLVQHHGEVLEKDQLLEMLWPDSIVEEANLPQNISALRKTLGESPSERRYILTIPGRGYRFAAEVKELGAGPSDLIVERQVTSRVVIEEQEPRREEATGGHPALPSAASPRHRRLGLAALLVAGLLVALAAGWYFWAFRKPAARSEAIKSLAVLPFKTLGSEGDEFLGVGMADTLITRLSNIRDVQVRTTSSVLRLSSEDRPPVEIGQRLGVESVLEGSIRRSSERIRVTVQLVRVADGAPLWAEKFDEKFTDIFTVEDSISAQVAESLMTQLSGAQRASLVKRYTENFEAYELYSQGLYLINTRRPDALRKGIEYFQRAIEIDPNYAPAYTGLAQVYAALPINSDVPSQEAFPKAKDAVTKALEIDGALAEAHQVLSFISFFTWDWTGCERAIKTAIELKPNDALSHFRYAHYLSNVGRHAEALAEAQQMVRLDPASPMMNTFAGQMMYQARRYDEAIAQLQKARELEANDWIAHLTLGNVYVQKGMYDEAIAAFQKAREAGGNAGTLSAIGHALAVSGKTDRARRLLDELKDLSKERYVPPYNIAMIHAGLGEKDQVFAWLERAYAERDVRMVFLKIEPKWDAYRTDPRFVNLLERVGLAPR